MKQPAGPSRAELRKFFDWFHYSSQHPSWDLDVILHDFLAGKSLAEATEEDTQKKGVHNGRRGS